MINVLILAGKQTIKTWDDKGNKALHQIHGKMMAEYVIDAVRSSKNIDKIALVGSESELQEPFSEKVDLIIESEGTMIENILVGVRHLGYCNHLLICTSDIPFITSEAIDDFIERSRETQADFCYPIVEKSISYKEFPDMQRTYVKMKEGVFTGGNIFYINPNIVEGCFDFADKLLNVRKSPLKMARILSINFLIHLILGNLSIEKAEKRFSEIMGIEARAIISNYPEIGNDVDKPDDILAATAHLSKVGGLDRE